MKWKDCKKCLKQMCAEYKNKIKDGNNSTWLFWLDNILVFPECEEHVIMHKFRLYLKTESLYYKPHKNFNTLKECVDYIYIKFKKKLEFESMIQLTKIRQELSSAI